MLMIVCSFGLDNKKRAILMFTGIFAREGPSDCFPTEGVLCCKKTRRIPGERQDHAATGNLSVGRRVPGDQALGNLYDDEIFAVRATDGEILGSVRLSV